MTDEKFILDLYINGCEIRKDEPLKNHTTFRIGGVVPYFIIPRTKEAFIYVMKKIKENNIKYKIIGGGANLIVKEGSLDFVVISTKYLTNVHVEDERIIAETGVPITRVALLAMENALTGLEFASGIPGSAGGSVFMNAGAYDGETKNVVESVEILDFNTFELKTLTNEELQFDYRHSIVQEKDYHILKVVYKLTKDDAKKIEDKTKELLFKRWDKQPLDLPSAGSIFKRPRHDFYVGTTIEKLGLKGFSVGDAQVSAKHAGFIVNKGNATYEDVINLINHIKKEVKAASGVDLEVEPEIWE